MPKGSLLISPSEHQITQDQSILRGQGLTMPLPATRRVQPSLRQQPAIQNPQLYGTAKVAWQYGLNVRTSPRFGGCRAHNLYMDNIGSFAILLQQTLHAAINTHLAYPGLSGACALVSWPCSDSDSSFKRRDAPQIKPAVRYLEQKKNIASPLGLPASHSGVFQVQVLARRLNHGSVSQRPLSVLATSACLAWFARRSTQLGALRLKRECFGQ
jgi:hypothetical protein